jgi:hypothetical protein
MNIFGGLTHGPRRSPLHLGVEPGLAETDDNKELPSDLGFCKGY